MSARARHGLGALRRGLLALSLAGILLVALAASTLAQEPTRPVQVDANATVATDPNGVVTQIELTYALPADPQPAAPADAAAPVPPPACTATRLDHAPAGAGPPPPGSTYALLDCGSQPYPFGYAMSLGLLPLDDAGEPVVPALSLDPEQLARWVRDRLPAPAVTIAASPAQALVGEPTWFWLTATDGTVYDGEPLEQTTTLDGVTVEVQAHPTRYTWDFGEPDAHPLTTTSTGHPAQPQIQHVYQRDQPDAQVGVTFAYTVTWRQPGLTPWADLEPITRSVTTTLPVAQSHGVLTR